MRNMVAGAVSVVIALSFAQGVHAQKRPRPTTDAEQLRALRKEVEELREGQKVIQSELEEMKNLLREIAEGSVAKREPTVSVDDDPSLGESTAKVVLIDFSDYQ